MPSVTATHTIDADPQKVWDTIASPATYENWLTIHTKWKDGAAPESFTEGAKVDEVVTMLGMANTISWTVEEFTAPWRLKIAGTGMAGVEVGFTLSVAADENGGAKAEIDATFEGQMITGALGKAIEADAQVNLDQSLENLTQLVTA